MAQQLTIKQIAEKAGVSVGTVDRILHNRGSVSAEAMQAVQAVLDKYEYRKNLHTSAVAFKKTGKSIKLAAVIPHSKPGEYWDLIKEGLLRGLKEYGDISIDCYFAYFDQFDSYSCKKAFDEILCNNFSAVIVSPTFVEETKEFCCELDKKSIPYIYVDGKIPQCHPVASYMADQDSCGRLMARMIDAFTPWGGEVAIFLPKRVGTLMSNNSLARKEAFIDHYTSINPSRVLKECYYTTDNPEVNVTEMTEFFRFNPNVKGIAVMISTGYVVSDALNAIDRTDVSVGGFDITYGNERCIKDGTLTFVINQHPEQQGFNALESMLHYLLYGTPDSNMRELLPIDVVLRENIS